MRLLRGCCEVVARLLLDVVRLLRGCCEVVARLLRGCCEVKRGFHFCCVVCWVFCEFFGIVGYCLWIFEYKNLDKLTRIAL